MVLLAIDPGPVESAYMLADGDRILKFGKLDNAALLHQVRLASDSAGEFMHADHVAVEMIASYGMPVGAEVFETCVYIGKLVEAWRHDHTLIFRREVKLHLCGSARAKDGNVRQALLDRWGGKVKAIGSKREPGPLRGISADVWSALAVAVTWSDQHKGAA